MLRGREIHASTHFTYPVRSPREIRELLENSGFGAALLAAETVAAVNRPGVSGPSNEGSGEFLGIVAGRL